MLAGVLDAATATVSVRAMGEAEAEEEEEEEEEDEGVAAGICVASLCLIFCCDSTKRAWVDLRLACATRRSS